MAGVLDMAEEGVEYKFRKSRKVGLRVSQWVCCWDVGVDGSLSSQGVCIPGPTSQILLCSMLF